MELLMGGVAHALGALASACLLLGAPGCPPSESSAVSGIECAKGPTSPSSLEGDPLSGHTPGLMAATDWPSPSHTQLSPKVSWKKAKGGCLGALPRIAAPAGATLQ